MIGQTKLLDRIDAMSDLPRFSIIVGDRGMEHEDVAKYMANKIKADFIRLPDVKIDTIRDMIKQAYKLHNTTMFCIPNADDMSVGAKNAMLKVAEDIPNKIYIAMCLVDLSNTLETIQSRGTVLKMQPCTINDIAEFARSLYADKVDEEEIQVIQAVCSSPGDVVALIRSGVKNFYNYAEWVVDNITNINGAESFKIADKLALKDEEDKYNCRLFLCCLQSILLYRAVNTEPTSITKEREVNSVIFKVKACNVISAHIKDLRIKGINKQMLIDDCILEIRRLWKSLN